MANYYLEDVIVSIFQKLFQNFVSYLRPEMKYLYHKENYRLEIAIVFVRVILAVSHFLAAIADVDLLEFALKL